MSLIIDYSKMDSKKQLIKAINEVIKQPKKLNTSEIEKLIYIRDQISGSKESDKILYYLEELVKLTGMTLSDFTGDPND